ncbi:MAG: hypothetical protein PHR06_12540 [Candidatus Cloacimonetes bacterium]|nr:hypothetical protein [Candidatus Cloacimonadota bacterium]
MRYIVRAMSVRQDCIDYLKQHLSNAEYIIDAGTSRESFLEALRVAGNDAVVLMEEDIWLTKNFKEKAEIVIEEHPEEIIQFFSMRQADIDVGSRYEPGRTFMMNQCTYLPAGYSKELLDYFPLWDNKVNHVSANDIFIADFLKERKEKYFLYVPSLVDHREGKSLINPRRPTKRQAKVFVDGIYDNHETTHINNKLLYPGGFVIFSDNEDFEKSLISEYLELDHVIENIVFVYSKKNKVDWSVFLNFFGKNLLTVPFEEYNQIEYAGAIEKLNLQKTLMIIKDLRFMEKRLDSRLALMQGKHKCYKKIVIDDYPYWVQKYRIYYPYSFFDKTLLGYSHSYAIERDIDNYENDMKTDNPFVIENIIKQIAPATFINYSKLFKFDIIEHIHEVTAEQYQGYEELKEELFILYEAGKIGDKKLTQQLQKYAKSILKEYSIPTDLKKLYSLKDENEIHVHRTDLKIDENVTMPGLRKLVNEENEFVKQLYEAVN